MTGRWVGLLRGINVGGKNLLPMKELVALVSDGGGARVETYIQSGNVLFDATPAIAARLPAALSKAIAARFGFAVPVMVRSHDELRRVVDENPFLRDGAAPESLHVGFLADRPRRAAVEALDPARSPGDSFVVREREIYLSCPNGYGRTKLTNAWFDAALATTSTMRNWRTVLTLLDLTDSKRSAAASRSAESKAARPAPRSSRSSTRK